MNQMIDLAVELLPPDPSEDRKAWIVRCPEIGLYTQGDTYEEAAENIKDALKGWFDACLEHGTLEQVLTECGFSPVRIASLRGAYMEAIGNHGASGRKVCHA